MHQNPASLYLYVRTYYRQANLPVCPSFSLHASPPLVVTVNSGILYIWCVSMDHIHHSFWRSVVPVLANGSLFISWHLCSLAWLLTFWRNKVSQGSLCKVLLWPWDRPLCKDPCAIWWRRFHKRRDHCCWLSLFTGLFGGYPKKKKKRGRETWIQTDISKSNFTL